MYKIIMILFSLFALGINSIQAAKLTIEVEGVATFKINHGMGTKQWNGQTNDDCRCWSGNDMNCSFEVTTTSDLTLDFEVGGVTIGLTGTLNPIDVEVQTGTGGKLNLVSKSDNFVVPESTYEVPYDGLIPGISAGTIIDIPTFTTGTDSRYTVTGTIRSNP
jgi:hypothetical protein